MRGEYHHPHKAKSRTGGSSPHAWGILPGWIPFQLDRRFIPTCVGNTACLGRSRIYRAVHPHMRGEYGLIYGQGRLLAGSSPHAWGIRPAALPCPAALRFIPTCVGNTTRHNAPRRPYSGSSPHAWGIRRIPTGTSPAWRFIPTCVGNTSAAAFMAYMATVHPHMRGEYTGRRCSPRARAGSSPHAWGIRHRAQKRAMAGGFIPTCVGNTHLETACFRRCRVHPHMRGEYRV